MCVYRMWKSSHMTTSLQMPNGRWRSLGLLNGDKQPNNPVERTAHSAGFVVMPGSYLWAAAHRER